MTEKIAGHKKLSIAAATVYLCIFVIMCLAVVCNIIFKTPEKESFGTGYYTRIDDNWQTADGKTFKASEIDELEADKSGDKIIFCSIPLTDDNNRSLVFRSKNCIVSVFYNETMLYSTDVCEAPFYMHSVGTRWNVVTFPSGCEGDIMELRVNQAYSDGRAKVDNFYFGDDAAIILQIIHSKLFSCVISLLMLFVGLVLLVSSFTFNARQKVKDHSLLWLSIFSIVTAFWCFLETNLLQLFIGDLRLVQLFDNMALVMGAMPLFLYLNSMFGAFRSKPARVLCILDAVYIFGATLLHMCGIMDYHQTLNGAVISYGIIVVLLIYYVSKNSKLKREKAGFRDRLFYILQRAGILTLGIGVFGDLLRYLLTDVLDRAVIIRVCLLVFIVLFGSGNVYHMILLIQNGKRAEEMSKLAYIDGLTGVSNRTAYIEKLDEFTQKTTTGELAVVMFDINNLKKVNDAFGHISGDEMIVHSAEIMKKALPPTGLLYRIGGDEFVALFSGSNIRQDITELERQLYEGCRRFEEEKAAEYKISIAHGVALCTDFTKDGIKAAINEADVAMYRKKYEMKLKEKESNQSNQGTVL